ncbi:MAG: SMP-30/gluconolactonase/LRE family protein [Armatimonadota bacterium]|nr:SMP-30/gluconolactonase/LRE family protein [Armatimonadota bacterium]
MKARFGTACALVGICLLGGTFVMADEHSVEKVVGNLQFTEGPVWTPWNTLLFSDIPANRIYELVNGSRLKVYREPSGNSNGLTFDKQGRLIACEHSNRRVTRTEKDGSVVVLADRYQGKRLNSPNDVVVKSDGSVYFTDPTYGIKKEQQELGFQGVYRIRPDGQLELLVGDFKMPNGLCFSPDEKLLYVADSSELAHIRVFDVTSEGKLINGRVFAKTSGPGGPDGMKVDVKGNLYVAGPGGVWVFDTTGKLIDLIKTPEVPANLAWGDEDGKTLYITARTSVYKVRLDVGGKLCR